MEVHHELFLGPAFNSSLPRVDLSALNPAAGFKLGQCWLYPRTSSWGEAFTNFGRDKWGSLNPTALLSNQGSCKGKQGYQKVRPF